MDLFGWLSLSAIALISIFVTLTSLKRSPGAGIIVAVLVIALLIIFRKDGLESLGLVPPESWGETILLSAVLGCILALASTLVIEPLTDRLAGEAIDHSLFDVLRGNLPALLKMLLVVWLLVAFLEELIFRGFVMTELAGLLGKGLWGTVVNLLYSSILFGLAHWYQGKSGALSTGLIGLLIGLIFIAGGYNLWLPILTHGFIDTIGLGLVYLNGDRYLKKLVGGQAEET
jgi:membrane protease YdiL (CAAX protease family)